MKLLKRGWEAFLYSRSQVTNKHIRRLCDGALLIAGSVILAMLIVIITSSKAMLVLAGLLFVYVAGWFVDEAMPKKH